MNVDIIIGVKNVIISILTKLIDKSIKSNVFPDSSKVASILSLYKKGNLEDMNSYRPIFMMNL